MTPKSQRVIEWSFFAAMTLGLCSQGVGLAVFGPRTDQIQAVGGPWWIEATFVLYLVLEAYWIAKVAPSWKIKWVTGIVLAWMTVIFIQLFYAALGWPTVFGVGVVLEIILILVMFFSGGEPSDGQKAPA